MITRVVILQVCVCMFFSYELTLRDQQNADTQLHATLSIAPYPYDHPTVGRALTTSPPTPAPTLPSTAPPHHHPLQDFATGPRVSGGNLSHKLAFVPLGQLCHMHQVLLVLLQLLNVDVGLPPVPGITRLPTAKACQCDFPFPFAVKLAATSQGLCCHCLLVLVPVFASEV